MHKFVIPASLVTENACGCVTDVITVPCKAKLLTIIRRLMGSASIQSPSSVEGSFFTRHHRKICMGIAHLSRCLPVAPRKRVGYRSRSRKHAQHKSVDVFKVLRRNICDPECDSRACIAAPSLQNNKHAAKANDARSFSFCVSFAESRGDTVKNTSECLFRFTREGVSSDIHQAACATRLLMGVGDSGGPSANARTLARAMTKALRRTDNGTHTSTPGDGERETWTTTIVESVNGICCDSRGISLSLFSLASSLLPARMLFLKRPMHSRRMSNE